MKNHEKRFAQISVGSVPWAKIRSAPGQESIGSYGTVCLQYSWPTTPGPFPCIKVVRRESINL